VADAFLETTMLEIIIHPNGRPQMPNAKMHPNGRLQMADVNNAPKW
jgi:hypothetical protein